MTEGKKNINAADEKDQRREMYLATEWTNKGQKAAQGAKRI